MVKNQDENPMEPLPYIPHSHVHTQARLAGSLWPFYKKKADLPEQQVNIIINNRKIKNFKLNIPVKTIKT